MSSLKSRRSSETADLSIWMRRAGIPAGIIGHSLGVHESTVRQYTRGHRDPYNKSAYLGMEFQILYAWQGSAQRGRVIANGKRALKAYRESKRGFAVPEGAEA